MKKTQLGINVYGTSEITILILTFDVIHCYSQSIILNLQTKMLLFCSYIFHLNLAFSFDYFLRCDGNDIDNEVDDDFNLISKWLLDTIDIIYFSALLHCVDWREMFYLTTHSTHFIYGYMASDIWLRTILIVRKETRCRHIGYSYRLTARVLLYAPSHTKDNTYHGLCYTSRGALALCGLVHVMNFETSTNIKLWSLS